MDAPKYFGFLLGSAEADRAFGDQLVIVIIGLVALALLACELKSLLLPRRAKKNRRVS